MAKSEIHDSDKFHNEEEIIKMPDETENDWSIETTIKFNQFDKNKLGNSNKPNTLNQKKQIESEKYLTKNVNQCDDMDIFFHSLKSKVEQFPTTERIEVKTKICTLINELQEKYLVSEQSRLNQPIYLFTDVQIPLEQNDLSSSSSIQSSASALPCLYSDAESESTSSESSDFPNLTT